VITWRVDSALLRPSFRADVEGFLAGSAYSWYVLSGFRGLDEQAKLYAAFLKGGPRAAPPGKSAHNYGCAVDIVLDADPLTPGLQPSWDTKLAAWTWLKVASIPHPRLRGGWRFGDWPHLEAVDWKDYAAGGGAGGGGGGGF